MPDHAVPAPTDAEPQARGWLAPLVLFLAVAAVYLASASYSFGSGDVVSANVASWQLATQDSFLVEDLDFPPLTEHPGRDIWIVEDADGNEVIARSPGPVVAAVPAYVGSHPSSFTIAPAAVTAAFVAAASITLFFLSLRPQLGTRRSLLAALVLALSTPVWSVAADGMWPHTITVLGICGMAWGASRGRWWIVGVFGGITLWGRLHAAVVVAVLGVLVGLRTRSVRRTIAVAVPSSALLGLQCWWTYALYGSWNPVSAYNTDPFADFAGEHRFDLVNQLGMWVSPDRGFLVWTPLSLVLLPAVVRAWRTLPDWSRALVWGGLAYTLLQAHLNRFSGGDAFYGYRLTLEFLACVAPAAALSAPAMGRVARALFGPVLGVQTAVIFVGALHSGYGSRAEDVWTRHSLFTPLAQQQPVALALFLVVAVLGGVLASRIWADPALTTRRR